MAAPDAETQKRLADWFASIGPGIQELLGAIYTEAPEAVSKVLSGGAWVADAGDPPLGELLAGGDATTGGGLMLGAVNHEPTPAIAGGSITVSVDVYNRGPEHPAFTTQATWTTPSGASAARDIDTEALEPGRWASIVLQIDDLEQGVYTLSFDVNPGGAESDAPPGASGTHLFVPASFSVDTAEMAAELRDEQAWATARNLLVQLTTSPSGAPGLLADALDWLATLDLSGSERFAVEQLRPRIPRIEEMDANADGRPAEVSAAIDAVAIAAARAMSWRDVELRTPVFEALEHLDRTF